MKKISSSAVVLLSVLASLPAMSFARNPVIQTMYTADPAPMVHNGTLYLFSSHDQDAGEANNFNMKNWVLSTTTDMVNWTQRGVIASLRDFPWAAKEISGWDGLTTAPGLPRRSSGMANGISTPRCKAEASACWWPIIRSGPTPIRSKNR
jgi:hypothetical protein